MVYARCAKRSDRAGDAMTENLFTWIPLYTELAQKLLEFERKQTDLIAMIKQMRDKGLPTISIVDKGRMADSPTDLPGLVSDE
jgi:hypothetical protein